MFSMRTTALRRWLALLAAVTAIVGLSTGATMASAQAAPTASAEAPVAGSDSGRRVVASAAPEATARASALAVSPGVSPPVSTIHVAPGGIYFCPSGVLCTEVWDPTASAVKVFSFYHCNTYSLSNWNGSGGWINFQTGGAWAYAYNQSGTVINAFPAGYQGTVNWSPAWYIKNC